MRGALGVRRTSGTRIIQGRDGTDRAPGGLITEAKGKGKVMKSLSKTILLLVTGLVAGTAQAAGDPGAGEDKSAACAACHGQDGNASSAQYPKLAGQGERYLVKQLKDYKSGARENAIMAGQVANLSEQDMKDIAAYYAEQEIKTGTANPDYVEKGEKIWRAGIEEKGVAACAGCHGPAGQGVEAAGFPSLAGQHAEYTISQLEAFRNAGRNALDGPMRNNDPNGMMRDIADRMTDREIRNVASFIAGLSEGEENQ
jgi:cytochrome c553